jgi:hypothetical protein
MRAMKRLAATIFAGLLLAVVPSAAGAHTPEHWRPTCAQAHDVTTWALDKYAQAFDGHLQLHGCRKKGEATRITRATVRGGARPEEFRVWVIGLDTHDGTFGVRIRPI